MAILREHYAEGRLTPEEFEQRCGAAFAARTMGELRPLIGDLPATGRSGEAARACTPAPWSRQGMTWIAVAGILLFAAILAADVGAGYGVVAVPPWVVALIVIRFRRARRPWAGRRAGRC